MSADLPDLLQEAHVIVEQQQARLHALAATARQQRELAAASVRQVERQLDEANIQHRAAVQRRLPNVALMAQRCQELRERLDAVERELQRQQHALKQIEQLASQIAMSSGSLNDQSVSSDPWALALRSQVIFGREEERVRLAREVHDGPAQVLANSLMVLESAYGLAQPLGSQKLLTMLDRMRMATREGLQEVRRFIADLRPGKLEEQGLGAAIEEYVRGYSNAYGTTVQLDLEPLPALPTETAIVLYRIVQEALQNAHKYARGATIALHLRQQHSHLTLTVKDNGPGFDVYEVARRAGQSSWGLTSMRERAELIGARFTVSSRQGQGTEVMVVLPLEG
ncbi:MAG: sensor histidine kinase [Roseiflexaceae bacterium]|nr:sensor histidine kinase [Roseiflexaceae bacterium]